MSGARGQIGFPGLEGLKGMAGDIGIEGFPGLPGLRGPIGFRGDDGLEGTIGLAGQKGLRSMITVLTTVADIYFFLVGPKGLIGDPAPPPPPPKSRGFFYTRHSQSSKIPGCPAGSLEMWTGYSLLHLTGDSKAHGQDLGMFCFYPTFYPMSQFGNFESNRCTWKLYAKI